MRRPDPKTRSGSSPDWPGVVDQLANIPGGDLRMDDHGIGLCRNEGERRQPADIAIRDGPGRSHHHDMTVRSRPGHLIRADAAARARPILDQDRLPPGGLEPGREHPGQRVGPASGRKRNDDRDRARGEGLRRRIRACKEERGGSSSERDDDSQ